MSLWAITSLFNPAGFRVRAENYRVFRARLPLPLVTVELAWDGAFAVAPPGADVLVRRTGGARLWQKERLLALALAALPPECDAVVAIDADIVIADPGWPAAVQRALERAPVVQAFSTIAHRDRAGRVAEVRRGAIADWTTPDGRLAVPAPPYERWPSANGHAWAARRDVLARHGFYDGCIVGGGDTAFVAAVTGCPDLAVHMHGMGPAQERRYRAWAAPLAAEIAGRVGYVDAEIAHLWHGTQADRRWRARHEMLRALRFDPETDLRLDETGVWQWASERPDLHAQVLAYFRGRREDGSSSVD